MSYMKIPNLYQDQDILAFRDCFAMEKVHGTSAHIGWRDGTLSFFSGGAKHAEFLRLFDADALGALFVEVGVPAVTVYGEAYGGKMMKMRDTYGPDLRFIVFEVRVGDSWLAVPQMDQLAQSLGFEVVPWVRIPATLEAINAERDAPSGLALRRGCGEKPREGVVLRPPFEAVRNSGKRVIAKHKREEFRETTTPRPVSPDELAVLSDANAIAEEWVTEMRLTHVLDGFVGEVGVEQTGDVIRAMVEDVIAEAGEEIVASKAARKAIGRRAAQLFTTRCRARLTQAERTEP